VPLRWKLLIGGQCIVVGAIATHRYNLIQANIERNRLQAEQAQLQLDETERERLSERV